MRFFATAQNDTARLLAERCEDPGAGRASWSAEQQVVEGFMEMNHRRQVLAYIAGALGALAATGLLLRPGRDAPAGRSYRVVDERRLAIGGLGLFIAVQKGLSRESLLGLGDGLRNEYAAQPNMVISLFDNVDAARTVKLGSRVVGEGSFQAAMAHQVAFYMKDSRTGLHDFTIYGEPPEAVPYQSGQ